jgi:transcription elongation GreA/GreB family factor
LEDDEMGARVVDVTELRNRISRELDRLSSSLMTMMRDDSDMPSENPSDNGAALQERIALLGQLAAGLAVVDTSAIPAAGAGYGSTVAGEELFSRRRHEYTLMEGSLVNIDAGQVSLGSPIGQALIGCVPGSVVEITLPHRRLRMRILEVTTILDLLDAGELAAADA